MANVFSTLIALATTPIAAKNLGAENFGLINFVASISAYASLFSGIGFSTYASREITRIEEVREVSNIVISLKMIFGIISFVFMILVGTYLKNSNTFLIICFISGFTIFLSSFDMRWVFISKERMVEISFMSLIGQIVFGALLLIFVKGSENVIIYALIITIPILTPTFLSFYLYKKKFSNFNFTLKYSHWRHLISESIPLGVNQIAIVLNMYFASLCIGLYFKSSELGVYSAGFRLMIACNMFLNLISTVMAPRVAKLYVGNRLHFFSYLRKYFFICILSSIILGGTLFCTSTFIISNFFGPEYNGTIVLLKLWSLGLLPLTSISIFSVSTLIACNGSKQSAITILLGTSVTLISLYLLIPKIGIIGAPISNILMELSVSLVSIIFLKNKLKISKIELIEILNIKLFYHEMLTFASSIFSNIKLN